MAIEERAIECCMTKLPLHDTGDAKSMKSGYIHGANDQHKIDIDKACEWLKVVDGKRFNGFDIVQDYLDGNIAGDDIKQFLKNKKPSRWN